MSGTLHLFAEATVLYMNVTASTHFSSTVEVFPVTPIMTDQWVEEDTLCGPPETGLYAAPVHNEEAL
jgi:hypothetical protein